MGKIYSKDKKTVRKLSDEAEGAIKRKAIPDSRLLRILISNDESAMPDSARCRMMAWEILASRGFKIYDVYGD